MWPFRKKKTEPPKTVVQKTMGGGIHARFVALETFQCPATNSIYVRDGVYNLRHGNDALEERVKQWELESKVRKY